MRGNGDSTSAPTPTGVRTVGAHKCITEGRRRRWDSENLSTKLFFRFRMEQTPVKEDRIGWLTRGKMDH